MQTLKTYRIVEFDYNDVPTVLKTGLTRAAARNRLNALRSWAKEQNLGFRYIMKRDTPEPKPDSRTGDHLWTGEITLCPNCDYINGIDCDEHRDK